MQPIYELLVDTGLVVDPQDFFDVPPPQAVAPRHSLLPYAPHRRDENGVAIFTSAQLEWCKPEDLGFDEDYHVIELEETAHPAVFAPTVGRDGGWVNLGVEVKRKTVHLYDRYERFRFIVCQLMAYSGDVPPRVLKSMPKTFGPDPWEEARRILKMNGWKIYYNRIPAILAAKGIRQGKKFCSHNVLPLILQDFRRLNDTWPQIKTQFGRDYFPNLRYIALRLMHRHGVAPSYTIPLARTPRKRILLDEMYAKMCIMCGLDDA